MEKVIIIEGCDASGKSTLASQIMQKYPNYMYIHNAVTDDMQSLHENTIDVAMCASVDHTVIIDRLHLSEKIYGTIFRNKTAYDTDEFDAIVTKLPNVVKILCVVDKETSMSKHAERKDIEMYDNVSKVWDMYNDVTDPSWIRYNWKTDNINLDTFEVTKK